MIDSILTGSSMNFMSTTHEPYLYHGIFEKISVYIVHQVDDFEVTVPTSDIVDKIFALFQEDIKQPLNLLGILSMYNGLDISQSNQFTKLSCETYIRKILEGHKWQNQRTIILYHPL